MARSSKKKTKKDDKKVTPKKNMKIAQSPSGLKNIGSGILVNEKFKPDKDKALTEALKVIYGSLRKGA